MSHKGRSVFKIIVGPLIAIMLLEGCLFYAALKKTGVTNNVQENAIQLMNEKSANRVKSLEHNFSEWSNLNKISERMNTLTAEYLQQKQFTYEDLTDKQEIAEEYLAYISADVAGLIKSNSVTGAFMILASGPQDAYPAKAHRYSGIYFRSTGQLRDGKDIRNIQLERGPGSVAEEQGISLGSMWQEDFLYNPLEQEDSLDFFMKPLSAADTYPNLDMDNLGYWAPAFYLNDDEKAGKVITYSQPLWDEERHTYGVIGVEVSVAVLCEQFQSVGDEADKQSYYLVSCEDEQNRGDTITCTVQFPLLSSVKAENMTEQYRLLKEKQKNGLYKIEDVKWAGSNVYGKINRLSVYPAHSTMTDKQWAVLALSKEETIFEISGNVVTYLSVAVLISVLAGILIIYFISAYVGRKIRRLTFHINTVSMADKLEQEKKSFKELRNLEQAVIQMREQYQNLLTLNGKEKERYLIALESSADAVFEYDCEEDCFVIYQLNKEEGKSADLKETRIERFLANIVLEGYCKREDVSSMTNFLHGRYIQKLEVQIRTSREQEYYWIAIRGRALCDKDNKVKWIIGNIRMIDEAKEKELQEQENNSLDKATKLFVNEAGESRIRKYLSSKKKDEGFSLCMIDLNQFQAINDCYGFLYGDILIEEVGELLRRYIHNDGIGIRIGGDEFLIFLKDTTKEETFRICNSICKNIEKMYIGEGEVTTLTCCIGFVYRTGFVDFTNLLRYAGSAMCEMKNHQAQRVGEYFELREEMENSIGKMEFDVNNSITRIMSLGYNDTIISVAFNVFEKCGSFKSAFKTILKKTGYTFALSRILVVNTDMEKKADYIDEQWYLFGMEPVNKDVFHYESEVYHAFLALFNEEHIFVTGHSSDTQYPPAVQSMMHYSEHHQLMYYAIYDQGSYMGYLQFKKGEDGTVWNASEIRTLKELAEIISGHYIQDKKKNSKQAEESRRV